MADDRTREPGDDHGRFDPNDPERTAAHRLGPPMRPMRPGGPRDFSGADTGFVDRVTDDGSPVDVAAVRRDDDLIEALAAGGAVTTADHAEFALASLLADWRDEIVTTPVPAGPSVDELLAAADRGRRGRGGKPPRTTAPLAARDGSHGDGAPSDEGGVIAIGTAPSRRNRRFGLIAGTAAAAVAILGGGTVLVNSAQPDGALWGVKEVVFSDAASQTLATSEAKAQIREAGAQIDSSNIEAARTALASARLEAAKVKDAKDRAALEEKIRAAEARAGMPVGSTDLGTSATKPPPQTSASSTKPTTPPPPPGTTVPLPPPPVDIMESPERPTSTTPRPTPTTPTTKPTTTTTTAPPTSTTRTTTRTTTTSAATTTTAVTTTTTPASTEPGSS